MCTSTCRAWILCVFRATDTAVTCQVVGHWRWKLKTKLPKILSCRNDSNEINTNCTVLLSRCCLIVQCHIFIKSFASRARHFQNHCAIPNCVYSFSSIICTLGMAVPFYEWLYLWLCILWQLYSDYNHYNDYDDNYDLYFTLYPCKILDMYLYVPQYYTISTIGAAPIKAPLRAYAFSLFQL